MNVRELRNSLHLSQEEFSKKFGLNLRVLQRWEQDGCKLSHAERTLLTIIKNEPEAVMRAVQKESIVSNNMLDYMSKKNL